MNDLGQRTYVEQSGGGFQPPSSTYDLDCNQIDTQSRRISRSVGVSPTLSKTRLHDLGLSGSIQGAGNISEYLDSTGTIFAHYEYDPFGKEVASNGTNANDFACRFSTKPVNSTTGLLYYGYRWHALKTSRWPSRDPIEEMDGTNLYVFGGNDAVGRLDRLAMLQLSVGFRENKRDLKGGMILELSPGNRATVPRNSLGVTLLKYKATPTCSECEEKPRKYKLIEYVVVYAEIHLLKSYDSDYIKSFATNTSDVKRFAIYSENPHAKDYEDWVNEQATKDTMEQIESKNSKRTYKTKDLCIKESRDIFFGDALLNRKAKDIVFDSINTYDKKVDGADPIHTYLGEENWGK